MISILRKKKSQKCISMSLFIVTLLLAMFPLSFVSKAENSDNRIMVSLGDSYSSGEGIDDFYGHDAPIAEKVKNPDWLAHRSQNSWPGMLTLPSVDGTMSKNRDSHWYFTAVSGAVTNHMLNKQSKVYFKEHWIGDYLVDVTSGGDNLPAQFDVFGQFEKDEADYVTLTLGLSSVYF